MLSMLASMGGLSMFGMSPFGNLLMYATGIMIVGFLILLGVYIYASIAYKKIGDKAGVSGSGIAWLIGVGPLVIIYQASKKHWWPFAMVGLSYFLAMIFAALSPIVSAILIFGSFAILLIKFIQWEWHTYVNIGKPGMWSLYPIFVGVLGVIVALISNKLAVVGSILAIIAVILQFIYVGMAAWGK